MTYTYDAIRLLLAAIGLGECATASLVYRDEVCLLAWNPAIEEECPKQGWVARRVELLHTSQRDT